MSAPTVLPFTSYLLLLNCSGRGTADKQCLSLQAGLLPVARCLIQTRNSGRPMSAPTVLPFTSYRLLLNCSGRGTADKQCLSLQAGLSPVARCLLPHPNKEQRAPNERPYGVTFTSYLLLLNCSGRGTADKQCLSLQAGLLPVARCLLPHPNKELRALNERPYGVT